MRSSDAQAKLRQVEEARAQVDAAQLNLGYCKVVAPSMRGKRQAGGRWQLFSRVKDLMVIVPLTRRLGSRQLQGTQLRKMRPGQKAHVEVDTYGKTFRARGLILGARPRLSACCRPKNAPGNFVKVVRAIPR